jgi:acylphosphatase
MGAMADQKAISATVTGRVQGVGYRYAAMAVAKGLGLKGWVRNTPDGSVEAWAQGDDAVVSAFVEYLKQGPRSARVASVDVRSVAPDATLHGFVVRT